MMRSSPTAAGRRYSIAWDRDPADAESLIAFGGPAQRGRVGQRGRLHPGHVNHVVGVAQLVDLVVPDRMAILEDVDWRCLDWIHLLVWLPGTALAGLGVVSRAAMAGGYSKTTPRGPKG